MPVHNAELWLDDSLASVLAQRFQGQLELSIYNDASTVGTVIFETVVRLHY